MCYICYGQWYRDLALNVLVECYVDTISTLAYSPVSHFQKSYFLYCFYSIQEILCPVAIPSWFSFLCLTGFRAWAGKSSNFHDYHHMKKKCFLKNSNFFWKKPLLKYKTESHLSFLPQSLPAGHRIYDNFSLLDFALLLDSMRQNIRNIFNKIFYIFKQFKILGKKTNKLPFLINLFWVIKWIGQGTKWFSWTCKNCNLYIIFVSMFIQKNIHLY